MNKLFKIGVALSCAMLLTGCRSDFLDPQPQGQVSSTQLASNPDAISKLLDGVYLTYASYKAGGTTNHDDFGLMGLYAASDLMTNDEAQMINHWFGGFYNFTGQLVTNSRTLSVWRAYYSQIFNLNKIISSIEASGSTSAESNYVLGQALVMRAYSYDRLTRFYTFSYKGHESDLAVPLTKGGETTGIPRSTVSEVYASVVADMERGISLLNGYSRGSDKSKVDAKVAKALAADLYLWMGNYEKAATYANEARTGYSLMSRSSYLSTGFSELSNTEAMWGFDHTSLTTGVYASFFSHWDSTNNGYAGLLGVYKLIDKRLYDAIPSTDYRKLNFNGASSASYTFNDKTKTYPAYTNFKFKDPSFFEGDYIYLRSSLLYYIEAESLARQGKEPQARQVLYEITSARDSGYTLSSKSGADLINEIILQKRIEMWGEGYAWSDQKRLGVPLVRNYTGTNHPSFGRVDQEVNNARWRFQIPQLEINNNENIVQNP
ncbi:RagB/SusD family nutrient uptake outer membrane protein [Bergeyella sp. RCAD1439]|uniref:RagB/SusD family nutrient uptake outer membrane protein n=1 Tax=Bergeyella anatis TaxID=3113737 RepID=UPI002E17BC0B|nr:RagB/SusD family nutrient uptake outer membrane protein [Bergeyella sp. RCAD1439]